MIQPCKYYYNLFVIKILNIFYDHNSIIKIGYTNIRFQKIFFALRYQHIKFFKYECNKYNRKFFF